MRLGYYCGKDVSFLMFFLQPKGTTVVTGSVLQRAAGAPARACASPAVITAVGGVVLTPATSWRGTGGIRGFIPFKDQKCNIPNLYTNKQFGNQIHVEIFFFVFFTFR